MALAATEIVHARVDGVRTEFPERGLARTVYTMRVLSALKGNQLSTIEVAVAGARSQTHSVVIEGAPEFAFGEEAVLFLWTSPHDGETGVLGLGRGTYRVAVDAQDRRTVFGDHAQGVEVDEFLSQAADAWLVSQMQAEAKEGK
jgi:hypothetical protein